MKRHEQLDDTAVLVSGKLINLRYTLSITEALERGVLTPEAYIQQRAHLVGKPNLVEALLNPLVENLMGQHATSHLILFRIGMLVALAGALIFFLFLRSMSTVGLSAAVLLFMPIVLTIEVGILLREFWVRLRNDGDK